LKAGFASVDITPPLGSESPGYFEKRVFWDVHDPLYAKAVVFEAGGSRVSLVGVDALSLKASTVREARRLAEAMTGIPGENIMVGASHDHQAGPTVDWVGDREALVTNASDPDFLKALLQNAPAADAAYLSLLARAIASAVALADKHKVKALCAVGLGREETVSFNRRFKMKDGREMTHPGKGNPDIVRPAGPIDPNVGVLSAWGEDGELLGCVVNFACHGTTLGGEAFSADWPHYLDDTIRGVMGHDSTVVFLNGACGDVTQVDNRSLRESEFGEKWSRRVGRKVGAEALKVLSEAEPFEMGPLESKREVLHLARREVPPDRLQWAKDLVRNKTPKEDASWVFARDMILLSERNKLEPSVPCEIQVIQLGPLVLSSSPAELFCQLGLDIKSGSTFPYTFIVELANGCIGYVPTEEAMGPAGGGYETRMGMHSFLAPSSGKRIVKASIELIRSLTPATIREKAGEKGKPWDYGSVGPEEV